MSRSIVGRRTGLILCALVASLAAGRASAESEPELPSPAASPSEASGPVRQRLEDAWWTGPVIANSPGTQTPGHAYVESYLFDARSHGSNAIGSNTFLLYGLADRLTVGMIPSFGFNKPRRGESSSGVGVGDLTLHAQYGLTVYRPGSWIPATAVALEQTIPTGKYDHLGRPSAGFGTGAYTTSLALYGQNYFWLPNGRILRSRINVSRSFASHTDVEDASVYGTSAGFRGRAHIGASVFVDNSWEYSVSRSWVLAVDFAYRHADKTDVSGRDGANPFRLTSSPSDTFAIVPAIEFSWTPNLGVLFGTRFIPGRANTKGSITPVVALSIAI
jgi:hypothetical protein